MADPTTGAQVLIVCPNIAIDHTVLLTELRPGTVQRTGPAGSAAGGKGANVARAAKGVGGAPRVLTFLARDGGDYLRGLFAAESLPLTGIDVAGAVRTCTVLLEESGRTTLLNEPGAPVAEPDWRRLLEQVHDRATGRVVGTGSLPPGAPVDGYARLVELVHLRGGECAIDTGTAALRMAAEAGADLLCPNLSEASAVLNGAVAGVEQVDEVGDDIAERAAEAARGLVGLGARNAAVTAGAKGVALADPDGVRWLPTVPVTVRNPIGAGDSFLAGTMVARERGADWTTAVRFGMATAAASVESAGAGVVDARRAAALDAALAAAHR